MLCACPVTPRRRGSHCAHVRCRRGRCALTPGASPAALLLHRYAVARAIWADMLSIAVTYFITLCLFPGLESEVRHCVLGEWLPILIMAVFNLSDFVGKVGPEPLPCVWGRGGGGARAGRPGGGAGPEPSTPVSPEWGGRWPSNDAAPRPCRAAPNCLSAVRTKSGTVVLCLCSARRAPGRASKDGTGSTSGGRRIWAECSVLRVQDRVGGSGLESDQGSRFWDRTDVGELEAQRGKAVCSRSHSRESGS